MKQHVQNSQTRTNGLQAELQSRRARSPQIQAFERALAVDGALILKFWMHLSRDAQKERLEALGADLDQAWRVTKKDWEHWEIYDRFIVPWELVSANDKNFARIKVLETFGDILEKALSVELRDQNEKPVPFELSGLIKHAANRWRGPVSRAQ